MKSFSSFKIQNDAVDHHNSWDHISATEKKLGDHYATGNYSPKQIQAVADYKMQSSHVNKSLRSHSGTDLYKTMPKKHYDIQHHLHAAIAKGPGLAEPLDVYHGTTRGFHAKPNADGTVTTHGFTSTSLDPGVARMFSGNPATPKAHVLRFKLPTGYKKGMYIDHLNHGHHGDDMGKEHEYILAHDQKWKPGAQYTIGSGHIVTEMHPHE